jgi:hypothetical protein
MTTVFNEAEILERMRAEAESRRQAEQAVIDADTVRQAAVRSANSAAQASKITTTLTNDQLAALRTEAQRLGRGLTDAERDKVLGL